MSMKVVQAKLKWKALEGACARQPHNYAARLQYISALLADASSVTSLNVLLAALEQFATVCPPNLELLQLWDAALHRISSDADAASRISVYEESAWNYYLPQCTAEKYLQRSRRSLLPPPSLDVRKAHHDAIESSSDTDQPEIEAVVLSAMQLLNGIALVLQHDCREAQLAIRAVREYLDNSVLAVSDNIRYTSEYEQLMRRSFTLELDYCSSDVESLVEEYAAWEVDERRTADFLRRSSELRRQQQALPNSSSQFAHAAEMEEVVRRLQMECSCACTAQHHVSVVKPILDEIDNLRGRLIGQKKFGTALMFQLRILNVLYFADVAVSRISASPPSLSYFPHASRGAYMHFCTLLKKFVMFGFNGEDAPPFQLIADIFTCATWIFHSHSFFAHEACGGGDDLNGDMLHRGSEFRLFLASHGCHVLHELRKEFVGKKAMRKVLQEAAWNVTKGVMEHFISNRLLSVTPAPAGQQPAVNEQQDQDKKDLEMLSRVITSARSTVVVAEVGALCLRNGNKGNSSGNDQGYLLVQLTDALEKLSDCFAAAIDEDGQIGLEQQQEKDSADVSASCVAGPAAAKSLDGFGTPTPHACAALFPEAADAMCRLIFALPAVLPFVISTSAVKKAHDSLRRSLRHVLKSGQLVSAQCQVLLMAWKSVQLLCVSLGHADAVDLVEVDFQVHHYDMSSGNYALLTRRKHLRTGDIRNITDDAAEREPPQKESRTEASS